MSMSQEQSIEFTGIGLWLFYVIIPILALATLRERTGRAILRHILVGAAVASSIVLFLAVWGRTPPHYFIRMRIADDRITLGFRWPKQDVVIPINGVTSISYWKRESLRRSFKRVQIDTSSEVYRSYGYNRMSDVDYQAIERLRARIQRGAGGSPVDGQLFKLP